jgi:S1-C subfamily serine protease
MTPSLPRHLFAGATLAACMLTGATGCTIFGIGVSPARPPKVEPDTPIWRRAAAAELAEKSIDDLVVKADATLVDMPLHSGTIRRVAEAAMPAVMSIYTTTAMPFRVSLLPIEIPGFSFRFPLPGEALGSAFCVHPDGYLLTNNHVIENAVTIKARSADEVDYEFEVVARDPVLDIALLRSIDEETVFPFIPFGDSAAVGVGDSVVAIGNPLGLGHSVSQGIISQTGRELMKLEDDEKGRQIEFLQTDTAINPGSSGGPLVTLNGAVVGMNTAIARSAEGIAFAVPTSQILEFLQRVLAGDGVEDPTER